MARVIWKFPIPMKSAFSLLMPPGIIRWVAVQGGEPHLWAEVDTGRASHHRTFRLIGTGLDLPEAEREGYRLEYAGSFQLEQREGHEFTFVGHIYEVVADD